MYSAFVLIPQFVQTPTSTGYGFGSSVTQAGLFLLPSTIVMIVAAPLGGRLSGRFGSKVPLVARRDDHDGLRSCLLAAGTPRTGRSTLRRPLLGVGVGFAFASMANLIVEAVRADQTGVATGMNAVMRTIGGAVGGQVAASILAASLPRTVSRRQRLHALVHVHDRGARGRRRRLVRGPGPRPGRAHQVSLEPQTSLD